MKICGKRLDTESNFLCTLPFAHYPTNIHGTLHLTKDGAVIAVVDEIGRGVESWLLTEE